MDRFENEAQACCVRGDYQRAIEFLDRALSRQTSARLYDQRAACHEQQGHFDAALKDAKKAIQSRREDPAGYLRAGSILVRMNKHNVALEIYKYALKHIRHVGQGYERLNKAQADLQKQLSLPKSLDPLTVLPRELAEYILHFLSFRHLMNACLVSKQWTKFIRSCPNLWSHLDLSEAQRKVPNAFVSRAINVARHRLNRASLSMLVDTEKCLRALVENCPIHDLHMLETGLQSENFVQIAAKAKHLRRVVAGQGTRICGRALQQILRDGHDHLADLKLHLFGRHFYEPEMQCHKLHALDLSCEFALDIFDKLSSVIVTTTPNLRSLAVRQIGDRRVVVNRRPLFLAHVERIDSLYLRMPLLYIRDIKLPPYVRRLSIANTAQNISRFWTDIPGGWTSYHLAKLEELSITAPGTAAVCIKLLLGEGLDCQDGVSIRMETFEAATSTPRILAADWHVSKLRVLHLNEMELAKQDIHSLLLHPRLTELQDLAIRQCLGCNDDCMSVIASELPKLQSLDVSESEITGVGVKLVVLSGNVKHLVLNECRFVSPDAVQWARAQGVLVEHRLGGGSMNGRRVRYGE